MKNRNWNMTVRPLALAVQAALVATSGFAAHPAFAEDDEVAALTRPTSTIEIGAANVSKSSAKFGEYSGLDKSGGVVVGNVSIRGGDSYGGDPGITRWSITGSNLGTTSRELGAAISQQGRWKVGVGYDELRHNVSDTYQTPLQGSLGSNNFTLPASYGTYNAQAAPWTTTGPNATQLAAFHTEKVGTTRKNTSISAGFDFTPQLSLQFDYNHLAQSGAKPMAFAAQGAQAATAPSAGTWRAEAVAILMNPTNYKTDNVTLNLNWAGDQGHLTGGYYGSTFRDGYNSITWQNAAINNLGFVAACPSGGTNCTYQTNTASTMPGNQFHQLNLTGGYAFSSATKLAGGLSYGRNTQNDTFLTNGMWTLPTKSSLNGLVITKHADLKLSHQATKSLALSGGFKYNERDNRTSSDTYYFTNLAGTNDTVNSAPLSNKRTQVEFAADYRWSKRHGVRLAYEHDAFKRWCNSYVVGGNNPLGANCVVSPSNKEDKLGLAYRWSATDAVKFNAGYTHAKRKSEFDHNAVTAIGITVTPFVGIVNAADAAGFIPYFEASRTQDIVKAGVNWQATELLSLGVSGRYTKDKYGDSTLGVQDGRTQGLNLDATYNYSEQDTVSAYFSWQNRERNMKAAEGATGFSSKTTYAALQAVVPTDIWSNKLKDDGNSFGINATRKGLFGGKLDLVGDLSYSIDKTTYSTQVPYNANCSLPTAMTCGTLPAISNTLMRLKVTGTYKLDKMSHVALGYVFEKRKSDDFYYNAYQPGFSPWRITPTMEQAPNYAVNMIAASYVYNFK